MLLKVVQRSALIASGGVSAILPMSILTAATSAYGVTFAAALSVALSFVGFFSQLLTAHYVEARLAPKNPTVGVTKLAFPVSAVGSIICLAGVWNPNAGAIGLCLSLLFLDTTRLVSIVNGRAMSEAGASATIGVAALLLFLAPDSGAIWWASAASVSMAVLIRSIANRDRSLGPKRLDARWIYADTAVTGFTQPIIQTLVALLMGPGPAVALRMAISTGNLFSPVLVFLRARLLRSHSKFDVVLSGVATAVIAVTLLLLEMTGLADAIFGSAWGDVTLAALMATVAWRVISAATTVPFTKLRRSGQGALLFALRALSTLTYATLCVSAAALSNSIGVVLAAFATAELATFVLYWRFAWKRG